jgi:hypothetical protein
MYEETVREPVTHGPGDSIRTIVAECNKG